MASKTDPRIGSVPVVIYLDTPEDVDETVAGAVLVAQEGFARMLIQELAQAQTEGVAARLHDGAAGAVSGFLALMPGDQRMLRRLIDGLR
jgi:hypothetical protein